MYSIILVDDERSLRDSIERLVEWEENGFHLIGTAENGLDALQLMQEHGVPDVLITDIKMPIMGGIELAKHVREEYPTIKIVFLSGYDEFQYAVEGIKLNVVSYLLKPISKSEIEECLMTLRKQLDEEKSAATDLEKISQEYHKNIELMRFSFLTSLLTENNERIANEELDHFLETHHLKFLKDPKILFTIRLSALKDPDEKQKNHELLRFSLFKIVREMIEKYGLGEVFLFSSYVICIFSGKETYLDENKGVITKDILESTQKLMNREVTIGVSDHYSDVFETKRAYRSSLTALDYTKNNDNGNIVFIGDVEKNPAQTNYFDDFDENGFVLALKIHNEDKVKKILCESLKSAHAANETRISVLRTLISIIYVNCMRALRETIGEFDHYYNDWYHQIFEATQYEDIQTINDDLYAFCGRVMLEIQQNRTLQMNSLVTESLEYLEGNYNNPKMSLKLMSQYLNVSPTYFSSIFKKETGKSFIDTLTEMKMNQAKDLVLTTNKKMYEIASLCGYEDQHYFSYSFKKYFDLSPTKMRNKLNELQNIETS